MVNVMVMMFPSFQDHQQKSKYLVIINHGFWFDQILIVFVIVLSSLWTCRVAAAAENRDTLKVGYTLISSSSSALVSASGKFTLLFLRNDSSSNYSYLYIRRNISGASKAWVANRDTPVLYPFGVLTLDTNNTLKIITTSGAGGDPPIVLGSAPKSSNTVVATLLDSGNFILQELNSDGSTKQVWWQSFDYPTDTFLPGMKLGVNHISGHIWSLTSWTSVYYPPPGTFILDWDPNFRQLEIRKQGVVYWRSGNFSATSNRFEFILPNSQVSFKFSIVSNEREDYLTYTSEDDSAYVLPEWSLNFDGRLYNFYGLGVDIARADLCGGYSTDGSGCQTKERPPNCTAELSNQFEHKKGYFKSSTSSYTSRCPYSLNFVSNGSYSGAGIDCNTTCLQDCDCLGFDFDNETGCRFWSVDCEFVEDLTQTGNASSLVLTKLMPTTKSPPPRKNGATHKWIWIGVAVCAALVVMAFSILCYLRGRRRRRKSKLPGEDEIDQNELLSFMNSNRPIDLNILQNDGKMGHDLSVFSYASVMAATSNFAEENKLGEGGFGPVYKGKLAMGREVAVKRLAKCSGQGTTCQIKVWTTFYLIQSEAFA
ncbi:hypothetical protein M0R45_014244 [Rubus argutus]|uniref:Bulb-type lectin domain-containing protein n=1 Tax=Rubus argutus TaxID=59490 RepID=A0AAW1XNK1_RUBAR